MGSKVDWHLAKMGVMHWKNMGMLLGSPNAFVKATIAYGTQQITNAPVESAVSGHNITGIYTLPLVLIQHADSKQNIVCNNQWFE